MNEHQSHKCGGAPKIETQTKGNIPMSLTSNDETGADIAKHQSPFFGTGPSIVPEFPTTETLTLV